jgi:hypothetical protein
MKRTRLLGLLLVVLSTSSYAQFDNLIGGTPADAKYLATGYITPMMKAFGYGMNNGWYNSGAPHKLGGFELTVSVAAVYVPALDTKYFVDNTKLNEVELLNGSGATATPTSGYVPTFFGGDVAPTYRSPKGVSGVKFQGPVGFGQQFLPTPGLTAGVGLPLGFEVKVRYVPTLKLSIPNNNDVSGNFGMWGIGIMHNIKQWIPGVKALPFDISAFVAYSKLNMELGFDSSDPNKKAMFNSQAMTIQALISKKLSILTVYGAVGYNSAKTDMDLKGTYDFRSGATITQIKDPFSVSAQSNGMRGTIGLRIRLAVIAFHADYTLQQYGKVITGGFGINFR